jgi:hypothetical protein
MCRRPGGAVQVKVSEGVLRSAERLTFDEVNENPSFSLIYFLTKFTGKSMVFRIRIQNFHEIIHPFPSGRLMKRGLSKKSKSK